MANKQKKIIDNVDDEQRYAHEEKPQRQDVDNIVEQRVLMTDEDPMAFIKLIVTAFFVITIIATVVLALTSGNYVSKPVITIKNKTVNADFGKNNKIVIEDEITDIEIEFGEGDKTCSKENGFTLTINDEIIEGLPDYCETYTIKNSDIPAGKTTYDIKVENKSGSDLFYLYVDNTYKENSKKANDDSKYPMTSSGWDLPTIAHVNCRSYASKYFYPDKVELNNILDGGDYDYQVDDGWLWKPIAWVTSSAGGKVAYQVVCKTDLDGHVTSFNVWK